MFRRNVAALLCLILCVCLPPARLPFAQTPAPPLLITEEGTETAISVEPVTRARDPFPVTQAGAVFDLSSNALRPAGWTSADAAGLPVFPGLVRYDEVFGRREITHALRFTAARTRRAYVHPARHFASSNTDPNLPPMGMRVRLKASVEITGYSPAMQVVLRALKRYGMILADNGSNWYVSGAPDPRWNDDELRTLKTLKGSDFEVVQRGTVVTQ